MTSVNVPEMMASRLADTGLKKEETITRFLNFCTVKSHNKENDTRVSNKF